MLVLLSGEASRDVVPTPKDLLDLLLAILGKENDHRKEHSWRMFHKYDLVIELF